jgi:hypothetical protein
MDILTMQLLINVKYPNNISNWHMEFNSSFKGLKFKIPYSVVLWSSFYGDRLFNSIPVPDFTNLF